ncbi:WD40 repeat-like protein [Aureobasidium pullulans]|uniref:WD40 repeat-like protein n=1 Tax=Aureobasidium pullulans TaxID=5580 RepID=A0A4S9XBN4_AURPU|nr:WD40 repeat-like protein [Aureobasidium pullulans]
MSDPDTRNHPSYSGHSLRRGSTVQGLRFDSRMIRSRRGSAISSLGQTPYPCDHLPGHLEDPDHGGVSLTWTSTDAFLDTGHHSRRLHFSGETTEASWDATEGDVGITTQADFYESRLHSQSNTHDRPPGHFINNGFMTTRHQQMVTDSQVSHIGHTLTNSAIELPPAHLATTPTVFPSSPVEAPSTRWPANDTTLTIPSAQPPQELHHDASAWVDYDVGEFLDHWDIQYHMGEAGLMHLDDQRKAQWQLQGQIPFKNYDLQGLDWAALNTTRSQARLARKMLYPLRYTWTPPATYDEHSVCRQQRMYASKDFYPHHKASHSHGQLRNVLAARSRNDVFYASKSKVMHTALSCPAYTNVVVNFSGASTNPNQAGDTHITTIAVSPATDFDGYYSDAVLVTGGLEGEYSVLNLNSTLGDRPIEGFVTVAEQKETTHVHVLSHRRTGALGAAFCSNDSKVRLLDIDTNSWSGVFEYENQINCAATSPDGRLRMIVGDTCETLITDAERGDVLFRTRQHTGYGFACAWAADGWHVATGSEDGKVVVYDARRWDNPLAALACEMSCARSLHFTTSNRGGASLVVAESDDIVSVYDAMNWHDKQTIDFFGSVVGAVSVDDGQELIIANGDETVGGLMVFERRHHIPDEQDDFDHQHFDGREDHHSRRRGIGFDDLML